MTFASAPAWLQLLSIVEAFAAAWLVFRFGWRGLAWGAGVGAASWFVVALGASYLVGRLEGGAAADPLRMLPGAVLATARVAAIAAPLLVVAVVLGGVLRWRLRPRRARRG